MRFTILAMLLASCSSSNQSLLFDAASTTNDASLAILLDLAISPDLLVPTPSISDVLASPDLSQAPDLFQAPDMTPVCTPGIILGKLCGCDGLACCDLPNDAWPPACRTGNVCQMNNGYSPDPICRACGGLHQPCCGAPGVHPYQLHCDGSLVCHCSGEALGELCRPDLPGFTECKTS